MPPIVYLLCGLTGSGKTTYAKRLEASGAVRLSVDEEVYARHGRYGVAYPMDEYWRAVDVPADQTTPTGAPGLGRLRQGRCRRVVGDPPARHRHDRAGPGVLVIRLTATCDTRAATEMSSDQPQVRRYQRIDRQTLRFEATGFDRFPGGCVTAQATVPGANRAEVTGQLATILGYTSRRALQEALDQRSGGRLRLDPPAAPPSRQPA